MNSRPKKQIATCFKSIFTWIMINKNAEEINYIHYNQQRFINHTRDALHALGSQVHSNSLMALQNCMALEMLLANRGGMGSLFGDKCCTFIPNNTASNESFTRAM